MSSALTKQEFQSGLESAKSRVLERLISKNDVQACTEQLRLSVFADLQVIRQENQQLARRVETHGDNHQRKIHTVERQLKSIERGVNNLESALDKLLANQERIMEKMNVAQAKAQARSQRYEEERESSVHPSTLGRISYQY